MQNPDTAAFESVGKIASQAQSHASALVRLARKLGFSGFPEMRGELQAGLVQRRRTDELIRARLEDSAESDILTRLIERELEAMNSLKQSVDQPQLEASADLLLAAERIFVLAEGTAEALARHASHRLRRAGQLTVQLHPDTRGVAEGVTIMHPGDAVIGFALREPSRLLRMFLDRAKALDAKTIVISDLSGLSLQPAPDQLLAAPRGSDIDSGTLTIPMTILNALILTVADRGAPETLSCYERYTTARDDLI